MRSREAVERDPVAPFAGTRECFASLQKVICPPTANAVSNLLPEHDVDISAAFIGEFKTKNTPLPRRNDFGGVSNAAPRPCATFRSERIAGGGRCLGLIRQK